MTEPWVNSRETDRKRETLGYFESSFEYSTYLRGKGRVINKTIIHQSTYDG
jgi:hypothetical protein